ncbi:MAG: universal stress protein [Nannocystaceae bacterium]|nr:universal stress protein [bacterium]
MSLSVDTVVVPVTFEPAKPAEINVERAIKVRDDHWVMLSQASVAALKLACELASDGGTVHIAHATLDLSPTATMHGPAGMLIPANIEELHQASKKHALRVLGIVADRFCKGTTPVLHVSPGNPLDMVLDYVGETAAGMLVLAASGRTRVERFIIGSTVDKLVRRAPCPVVVVPG